MRPSGSGGPSRDRGARGGGPARQRKRAEELARPQRGQDRLDPGLGRAGDLHPAGQDDVQGVAGTSHSADSGVAAAPLREPGRPFFGIAVAGGVDVVSDLLHHPLERSDAEHRRQPPKNGNDM